MNEHAAHLRLLINHLDKNGLDDQLVDARGHLDRARQLRATAGDWSDHCHQERGRLVRALADGTITVQEAAEQLTTLTPGLTGNQRRSALVLAQEAAAAIERRAVAAARDAADALHTELGKRINNAVKTAVKAGKQLPDDATDFGDVASDRQAAAAWSEAHRAVDTFVKLHTLAAHLRSFTGEDRSNDTVPYKYGKPPAPGRYRRVVGHLPVPLRLAAADKAGWKPGYYTADQVAKRRRAPAPAEDTTPAVV